MGRNANTEPAGDSSTGTTETAQPVAETPVAKISRVVEEWFMDAVANSPVSRETNAWNHMVEAKERLKAKLAQDLL